MEETNDAHDLSPPMLQLAKPMPLTPESVEIMARACGVWADPGAVVDPSAVHNAKLMAFARSVREAP